MSACALGPDFHAPEAPAGKSYNQGGDPTHTVSVDGEFQRFVQGQPTAASWWQLFQSAELDAALADALARNPGLQAAQASLRQSESNLQAGYGIFYPQVSAGAAATRERLNPAAFGAAASPSIFNLTTLSASVSYAVDLFGGQRRTVEGLQAQVDAQRAQVAATYLVLTGNVVNTVVARSAYQAQIDETQQLIALEREQLALTEKQVQAGTVAYSAVTTLQSQLAALEAPLPTLRQHLAQADHLLATLAGTPPSDAQPPQVPFARLALPPDLPLALPSELARNRPDIVAAEAQLHAASAAIGVATAALFPSLTITGDFGQQSLKFNQLLASSNKVWGVGADLSAPLFNGGTLLSRRQAALDAYQQNLALYRQVVLAALAQVADAITALTQDAQVAQAMASQMAATGQTLALLKANYQAGLVNYQQVLAADIQWRQAHIGLLQARAQQLQDTTAFVVALGGNWRGLQEAVK